MKLDYFYLGLPLTDWFPSSVKPTIIGVYEVTNIFGDKEGVFAYFDGLEWGGYNDSIEGAITGYHTFGTEHAQQSKQWRGLAEQPKGI